LTTGTNSYKEDILTFLVLNIKVAKNILKKLIDIVIIFYIGNRVSTVLIRVISVYKVNPSIL
jgi:hypothetical protein